MTPKENFTAVLPPVALFLHAEHASSLREDRIRDTQLALQDDLLLEEGRYALDRARLLPAEPEGERPGVRRQREVAPVEDAVREVRPFEEADEAPLPVDERERGVVHDDVR